MVLKMWLDDNNSIKFFITNNPRPSSSFSYNTLSGMSFGTSSRNKCPPRSTPTPTCLTPTRPSGTDLPLLTTSNTTSVLNTTSTPTLDTETPFTNGTKENCKESLEQSDVIVPNISLYNRFEKLSSVVEDVKCQDDQHNQPDDCSHHYFKNPDLKQCGFPKQGVYKKGVFSGCDKSDCALCTYLVKKKLLKFVCAYHRCEHWHEFSDECTLYSLDYNRKHDSESDSE